MNITPKLRVVANQPPELVVYDEPGTCSYLKTETWRLPLRLPVRPLTREEFGARLAEGDRRQGRLLYRTACPTCRACEPIRLDVSRFVPTKTQRRVLRKGDAAIEVLLGPPVVDPGRVRLYNAHKNERDLASEDRHTSADGYRTFLGQTCCETFEMRYLVGSELCGVAVVDRADDALSAVYCYWDPARSALSLGTYSILKQLELCRLLGLRYLYLGLFIGACEAMSYKARYLPHERLIDGEWREFARS
ncbi:MAG: arginyltransferase [Deltaproteobacteria bacterium]|nr:arginyltransferase [Deltaproteobacteria bacterium]